MKAMVCELCGSNDIMKQDGCFVCQHCGTKYSVEEAKKLIEVKIDSSDRITNLYKVARQARDNNDLESAAKHYELLRQEDPDNWEPMFYSVYFRAMQTKIAYIARAANTVSNSIPDVLSKVLLLKDTVVQTEAVKEIYIRVKALGDVLVENSRRTFSENFNRSIGSGYLSDVFSREFSEYSENSNAVSDMLSGTGVTIDLTFPNKTTYRKMILDLLKTSMQYFSDYVYLFDDPISTINKIKEIPAYKTILKYEPSYSFPNPNTKGFPDKIKSMINAKLSSRTNTGNGSTTNGGCYIATAVYGSYDCPQVWTLRRYRDYTLAESWYGRAFIRTYYAISPTLVKWIGKTQWFKNLWKPKLDRMVKRLNMEGVENSPYHDRDW